MAWLFLITLLYLPQSGVAQPSSKLETERVRTTEIQTKMPAKDPDLRPFFAGSAGSEIMEKIDEIMDKLDGFEKRLQEIESKLKAKEIEQPPLVK